MGNTAQGFRFLLIAASLVVVIAGLRAAAPIALPFALSLLLAILSLPLLLWLQDKRIPTTLAVLLTVLANIVCLGTIVLIVGGSVESFTREAPKYADRLQQMNAALLAWLQSKGIEVSPEIARDVINPGRAMAFVGQMFNSLASVLSNFILVIITTIFILFEITQFPQKLRLVFGSQDSDSDTFTKIVVDVQRYLGIKTLISLATGILIGVWVAILGVDFPILWGFLAFLFNYIPNLGSILAAVPTLLLALVQLGPGAAALVGLGYLAVNMVLGTFVEPYFMGRKLGLSTLVIFLSLVFWGWVWGPVGMLLSVPLTMVVKILLENSENFRWVAVLLAPTPAQDG
ncbi:MAG: AI-2E family transporter [candidate division NC10 bacterium]|nr:AI-2E family transporter [candidate division NC10 bacterium]MCZ6549846.1 AI-2E family transporter [candidate division NC10 bacterium]